MDERVSDTETQIVWMRIFRCAAGLLVGAGLGVSGALIQAITRNSLGDPGILGVNAGAMLGVAVGVGACAAVRPSQQLWWAFAGALLTTLLVMGIAAIGRYPDPLRLVLAGVAVGAALSGVTTALVISSPATFRAMRNWGAGSLAERHGDVLGPAVVAILIGLTLAALCTRPLNAMGLGDDIATAVGTNVALTRVSTIVAVTLLAGTATSVAGPVGFIGLMVPHVSRWFIGPDQCWIVAYSIVLAPMLLLVSDVVSRIVMWPTEVPVGVVTSFVGAPVVVWIVRRRRVSTL